MDWYALSTVGPTSWFVVILIIFKCIVFLLAVFVFRYMFYCCVSLSFARFKLSEIHLIDGFRLID